MSSAPALIVQERVGRGRGLVAARELHAGEVVLNEPPLILTPSLRCVQHVCCFCLAVVDGRCMFHHCSHQHPRQAPPPPAQPAAPPGFARPNVRHCPSKFLTVTAHGYAGWQHAYTGTTHTRRRCLTAAPWASLQPDDQDSLYFLLQVYALQATAAAFDPGMLGCILFPCSTSHTAAHARLAQLQALSTAGMHPANTDALTAALVTTLGQPTAMQLGVLPHDGGCRFCIHRTGVSKEFVAGWLAREQVNSFGIMAQPTNEVRCILRAN